MTTYADDELQNDWEFKIVRAYRAVFAKPEAFKKLLSEEERAGWILLEKLDDNRVRFKRRRSGQANDAQLISEGIDPYRTQYGTSQMVIVLVIAIIAIVFVFGFLAFIIFFNLQRSRVLKKGGLVRESLKPCITNCIRPSRSPPGLPSRSA